MTIEEICQIMTDKGPQEIAKLSDAELVEHLKYLFTVTRPEFLQATDGHKRVEQPILNLSPEKKKAMLILQEQGIDLSALMRKKKK